MRILNAAVIALEIISDIAAKWLFAQEDVINIERTRLAQPRSRTILLNCLRLGDNSEPLDCVGRESECQRNTGCIYYLSGAEVDDL